MASSKQRSSLPSLPPELIEEILCRTPAESLIRLELTCKKWYALITDQRFIYNHLRRSPERFLRAVERVQIVDPVTGTSSASPIPDAFQRPYEIFTMVHCDGLMLCMCGDRSVGLTGVHLAIWNPFTRKIRWVDPSQRFTSSDYYGIGYDNRSRDDGYKIVRFYYRRCSTDDGEAEAEIYELKTNSWKTLDATVDWEVHIWCKGVAVMGNMYWIARKKKQEDDDDMYWIAQNKKHEDDAYILGFDFSDETFKNICVCPPASWIYCLGCFNGDRLSLLQEDGVGESRQIDVWVSNMLADGNVSFSKYFSVARPDLPEFRYHGGLDHPVYCFGKHKSVIVWCEEEKQEGDGFHICLTLYEIDEDGLRKQVETNRDGEGGYGAFFFCGYVYVPSLIPLP